MKNIVLACFVFPVLFIACGPSAEELAKKQKEREDSLVNAALIEKAKEQESQLAAEVEEIESQITAKRSELDALINDVNYVSNKKKLETVRARVSTGASYGWIDGNGKFWEGKEANEAFNTAAQQEAEHEKKIETKKGEIAALEEQIEHLQAAKQ